MSAYGGYLQRSLSNASIAGDGASYAERGLYRSYSLPEVVTTLPHLSWHERAHYAYQPRYYVPTFHNPYRFYVGGNYGHYSGYNWRNYWNWSSRPEYIYSRPREYPTYSTTSFLSSVSFPYSYRNRYTTSRHSDFTYKIGNETRGNWYNYKQNLGSYFRRIYPRSSYLMQP